MSFLFLTPIRSFFSIGMSGSRLNVEATTGLRKEAREGQPRDAGDSEIRADAPKTLKASIGPRPRAAKSGPTARWAAQLDGEKWGQ